MKDIEQFCKLYKVNIPVPKYFNYYITQLNKSKEYEWLNRTVKQFQIYENIVDDIEREKFKYLDKCIDFLHESEVHKRLVDFKIPENLITFDKFKESAEHNNIYISIDMSKANFQTFKFFDEAGELGISWDSFCNKMKIPYIFRGSKSFRQHIFGNLNPKRTQSIQKYFINLVYQYFCEIGYKDNVVYLSHDEIILTVKDNKIFSYANLTNFFIPNGEK